MKFVVDLIIAIAVGYGAGFLFKKYLRLPKLIGYIFVGIILGPAMIGFFTTDIGLIYWYDVIAAIAISFVILKAGIGIHIKTLKKVGFRSLLLGVVPAVLEATAVFLIARYALHWTVESASVFAFIMAAVSPAIVIPSMLKLKKGGYDEDTTTMTILGASIDDVFAISMFSIFFAIATTGEGESMLSIPVELISGAAIGVAIGFLINKVLWVAHSYIRGGLLMVLSIIIMLFPIPHVASMMVVLFMGISFTGFEPDKKRIDEVEDTISLGWKVAQIPLFVVIGAVINFALITDNLFIAIAIIFIGVSARMFGVFISLIKSKFNDDEIAFVSLANIPKATVQASIGALPLMAGIINGGMMLSIATIAIIITAPLGLIIIEHTGPKLLKNKNNLII